MSNLVAFLLVFAITLAIGAAVQRADAPLRRAGYDVVSLELARNPRQSQEILDRYRADPDGLRAFHLGLLLDSTLFIPAYAASLLLGCRLSAEMFRSHGFDLGATVGEVLQVWAVYAAALDYLENYGLYRQAALGLSVFWWRWTFGSSLAKWLIIGLAMVYGLMALASFAFWSLNPGRVGPRA